jgi:hypothetical protein
MYYATIRPDKWKKATKNLLDYSAPCRDSKCVSSRVCLHTSLERYLLTIVSTGRTVVAEIRNNNSNGCWNKLSVSLGNFSKLHHCPRRNQSLKTFQSSLRYVMALDMHYIVTYCRNYTIFCLLFFLKETLANKISIMSVCMSPINF